MTKKFKTPSISAAIESSSDLTDIFSKEFLGKYFESGFGGMTKHDIDLLVYHLISNKTDLLKDKSNYELSNLLMITETKVKNIQLESYLKYGSKDNVRYLNKIKDEIEAGNIKPELENDKIRFILDNSILKREFEYAIKSLGHVVDYSFNKDIISIKLPVFISVISDINKKNGDELESIIRTELKKQFRSDKKELEKIKGSNISDILKEYGKKIGSDVIVNMTTSVISSLIYLAPLATSVTMS